jgi:hypothetical protein
LLGFDQNSFQQCKRLWIETRAGSLGHLISVRYDTDLALIRPANDDRMKPRQGARSVACALRTLA